jgi:hypothetical protein
MNSYRLRCVVQVSCAVEELQTLGVTIAKNKYNKCRIWDLFDPEDGDSLEMSVNIRQSTGRKTPAVKTTTFAKYFVI